MLKGRIVSGKIVSILLAATMMAGCILTGCGSAESGSLEAADKVAETANAPAPEMVKRDRAGLLENRLRFLSSLKPLTIHLHLL